MSEREFMPDSVTHLDLTRISGTLNHVTNRLLSPVDRLPYLLAGYASVCRADRVT